MSEGEKMLKITLVRSLIGRPEKHRRTVRALGLKRLNHTVVQRDVPEIRGMIRQVQHLLKVEPFGAEEQGG
jgi:large subunit ribosomal protein L30